ncbi:MAG: protein kinase [Candidatus Sericytochromatia bacterium]
MSNFPRVGSPQPLQNPVSQVQPKPLTVPTEVEPQTTTTVKHPITDHSSQPLNSSETLESIESNQSPPQDIQSRSQQLGGLKQSLAQSIGVTTNLPVNNAPPPKYSPEEMQTRLSQHLDEHSSLNKFSGHIQQRDRSTDSLFKAQKQLQVIDESLETTLKQLDKRKKTYNSPLYRLADKLGIKSRKTKLDQLEQLRSSAIKANQAMKGLNTAISEHDAQNLEKLTGKIDKTIIQAKTDGIELVKAHKDDKAMMWNLSVMSKGQLRESLSQTLVSRLENGEQLLGLYQKLSQDYSQHRDSFNELKAKVTLYKNRIDNFNKELRSLETSSPLEAQALKTRFEQERVAFEQTLMPLVEKAGLPEMVYKDEGGNLRLDINNILPAQFSQAPPRLFDVLPPDHQNYIDAMASGIQESLPNKIHDDGSVMINGQKYVNKTFLAEAGFAKVYTYELEGDKSKKIVVKVPHKPEEMSEQEFTEKLEIESVRELQSHYHAMGVGGGGHDNLVKLIGAIPTEQGPLIAMEFVDKGNCDKFINGINGKITERLKNNEITPDQHRLINKHVLLQMMEGLQYMQDRGMTHLDVKYDNFLVHSDGTVKVADLGLSKTQSEFRAKLQDRGDNAIYLPPELMAHNLRPFGEGREISNKIDIWSVGVMGHEMLLGTRNRLDAKFMNQIEKNISAFGHDMNNRMFENPANETEVFLNKMLHADPNKRVGFRELMQDPIFDELFEKLPGGGRGGYRQDVSDLVIDQLAK